MRTGAYRAIGHVVLFGKEGGLRELATLHGDENIARPGPLQPHSRYAWRVVAQMADGTQRAGPTWSFTTGSRKTCVVKGPDLVEGQSDPTPPSCAAALIKCCGPGSGHGNNKGQGSVQGQGDKCMSHIQVIPTPWHVLGRISPIFPRFFPYFARCHRLAEAVPTGGRGEKVASISTNT